MKKRLFASVGLSLLALNVFDSAAHAIGNTEEGLDEFTQDQVNSDVAIQFKGGTLKLDYVSDASFGNDILVSDRTHIVPALEPYNVRVADSRGTKTGWSLGVSFSPLVGENGKELRGAILMLSSPKVTKHSGLVVDEEVPSATVKRKETYLLNQGSSFTSMLLAKNGQGSGIYNLEFATNVYNKQELRPEFEETNRNAGMQLRVPGGSAEAQSYKGHLTWVLTNAPA